MQSHTFLFAEKSEKKNWYPKDRSEKFPEKALWKLHTFFTWTCVLCDLVKIQINKDWHSPKANYRCHQSISLIRCYNFLEQQHNVEKSSLKEENIYSGKKVSNENSLQAKKDAIIFNCLFILTLLKCRDQRINWLILKSFFSIRCINKQNLNGFVYTRTTIKNIKTGISKSLLLVVAFSTVCPFNHTKGLPS